MSKFVALLCHTKYIYNLDEVANTYCVWVMFKLKVNVSTVKHQNNRQFFENENIYASICNTLQFEIKKNISGIECSKVSLYI